MNRFAEIGHEEIMDLLNQAVTDLINKNDVDGAATFLLNNPNLQDEFFREVKVKLGPRDQRTAESLITTVQSVILKHQIGK